MIVNTNQMLSVSEANQNFSKATKLADQKQPPELYAHLLARKPRI